MRAEDLTGTDYTDSTYWQSIDRETVDVNAEYLAQSLIRIGSTGFAINSENLFFAYVSDRFDVVTVDEVEPYSMTDGLWGGSGPHRTFRSAASNSSNRLAYASPCSCHGATFMHDSLRGDCFNPWKAVVRATCMTMCDCHSDSNGFQVLFDNARACCVNQSSSTFDMVDELNTCVEVSRACIDSPSFIDKDGDSCEFYATYQ